RISPPPGDDRCPARWNGRGLARGGGERGQMADKRHEGERACCCDQADGSCAGLAVRRLSQQRVRELAEEIWTASTGTVLPPRCQRQPRGAAGRAAATRRHSAATA